VLTAAILVAGIRLWMQVRGKTKTPFAEWAIGWGSLFFFLALVSEAYPQAASSLAGTIVVGDFLVNGASLFEDLTGVVKGAETGPILVDTPFAATAQASPVSGHRAAQGHASNPAAGMGAPLVPGSSIPGLSH
jgi:hypothetical protein